MADLNNTMHELQRRSSKIGTDLKVLLSDYDTLFREINVLYMDQRTASDNSSGFEEFHRLIQTVRRNRDVVGSLVRGLTGIRSMDKFKIIEEDVPEEKPRREPKKAEKIEEEVVPVEG